MRQLTKYTIGILLSFCLVIGLLFPIQAQAEEVEETKRKQKEKNWCRLLLLF